MKHDKVRTRVNRKAGDDDARPVSSAGKDGVSIDPPNYGIDFLDSELSTAAAVSGLAAAIQLKQATGRGRPIPTSNAARAENTGYLPNSLKAGIEYLSGVALNDVKVHYNSTKPARLQAVAFAQGTNIYLAPRQEKCLPHEAWHVVQQKQGRVKPTSQINGVAINAYSGLENEANIMGAKAYGMIRPYPRAMSQALPGAPRSGQHGATQESGPASTKAADARQMTPKAESSAGAVAQRLIGLELEFPIPVDKLGKLSTEQEELLRGPLTEKRWTLQEGADLDKDITLLEGKGFKVVVDHQKENLKDLYQKKPAKVIWPNILEFVFKPPVESLKEVRSVLDNIYAGVEEVRERTRGLTERRVLKNGYYVGPINTNGEKPDELDTRSNSLQVNIGVETGSIAKFIGGFAGAPELQGEGEFQGIFQRCLREARQAALEMIETTRETEGEGLPLRGLEGLFAIIALYLAAGKEDAPGTVKNFTPLLLKTPISSLVKNTLTKKEQELWKVSSKVFLKTLLSKVRGENAQLTDFLVESHKGRKAGTMVSDLITEDFKAPFIAAGKAISARNVSRDVPFPDVTKGAVFETRYSSGKFGLDEAYQRAKEVFDIEKAAFLDWK